jgi:hypothetical protein
LLPGGGGWRFELEGVKLDKEVVFFVIESALRSMGIRSFKDLEKNEIVIFPYKFLLKEGRLLKR